MCGGGIARDDESTWRALLTLFPGEYSHRGISFTQCRRTITRIFFPCLGCSPISAVHNIQTRTFRLALHSQSNTHSSSSSSSSHRVRTVKNSTTTSDLCQGVHLAVFFLHLPRTCVCACLRVCVCVCAYLSTLSTTQGSSFPPWNCHFLARWILCIVVRPPLPPS